MVKIVPGTLDSGALQIINDNFLELNGGNGGNKFDDIYTKLNLKADKTYVDTTFLKKTDKLNVDFPFLTTTKNLFNASTVENGKYVQWNDGVIRSNASYSASDFIEVFPGAQYTFTPMNQHAWYDSNKVYISGGGNTSSNPITAPANAAFVRLSLETAKISEVIFNDGQTAPPQLKYEYLPSQLISETSTVKTNLNALDTQVDKMDTQIASLNNMFSIPINLFNKNTVTNGKFVLFGTGTLGTNASYSASDFIEVVPGTQYYFTPIDQHAWYTDAKTYISGGGNTSTNPITAPANAKYVRLSLVTANIDSVMFSTSQNAVPILKTNALSTEVTSKLNKPRLYTISQIFHEWQSGNKFPIAFFDDSQTDGLGTTGFVANTLGNDSTSPNAYPKILENTMRELSGNSTLRIYNAGYQGKDARWAVANFDGIFGDGKLFADSKIVFLGFGTNDRILTKKPVDYLNQYKSDMKKIIEKLIAKGMQPVLMTEQPVTAPDVHTTYAVNYPVRNSGYINSVSNKAKFDLANEYNLEIVDLNGLLQKVMHGKKSLPLNKIYNGADGLHFGDEGHKLVRDVFASVIYPYTLKMKDSEIIDLTSQYIYKGVPENKVNFTADYGLFKGYCDYTVTANELLLKQSVYIDDYNSYKVRCYKRPNSTVELKIDGVTLNTPNSTLETKQDVITLEPGYHDIEVWSGATNAGFIGVSLARQQFEM